MRASISSLVVLSLAVVAGGCASTIGIPALVPTTTTAKCAPYQHNRHSGKLSGANRKELTETVLSCLDELKVAIESDVQRDAAMPILDRLKALEDGVTTGRAVSEQVAAELTSLSGELKNAEPEKRRGLAQRVLLELERAAYVAEAAQAFENPAASLANDLKALRSTADRDAAALAPAIEDIAAARAELEKAIEAAEPADASSEARSALARTSTEAAAKAAALVNKAKALRNWQGDIVRAERRLQDAETSLARESEREVDRHRRYTQHFAAYRNLVSWWHVVEQETNKSKDAQPWEARAFSLRSRAQIERVGDELRSALEQHGLYERFVASLRTGSAIDFAPNAVPANEGDGADLTPLIHLAIESKHTGDETGRKFRDFGIGATIGFQPTLSLVHPEDVAVPKKEDIDTQFEQALRWSLSVRYQPMQWEVSEAGFYGRAGQTILTDTRALGERNGQSYIARHSVLDRAAAFWEVGAELNIFGKSLQIVHAEKSFLDPLFNFALGYRSDARLNIDQVPGFSNAERRLFGRFMFGPMKLSQNAGEPPKAFTISFGVEVEGASLWGLGFDDGAPATTRILVRGDVNVLKALQGNH